MPCWWIARTAPCSPSTVAIGKPGCTASPHNTSATCLRAPAPKISAWTDKAELRITGYRPSWVARPISIPSRGGVNRCWPICARWFFGRWSLLVPLIWRCCRYWGRGWLRNECSTRWV
ncbi:Uncharacterised protein [Mycobacterium tuberculosis]|nr:Uncharacterised protein [Mycobacterium tuberculosis]